MDNLSKPVLYLAAVLSSISSCWAAGTSVCIENAFGDTRRVNNVPVVFRPINANTADFVVVAGGTFQQPHITQTHQWAFVENGGEFFEDRGGTTHSIFIAPGGYAELDSGGDHRVYVQSEGTLTCSSFGGTDVRIDYEPNAVLVGCNRAVQNRVAATKRFERCSSRTPVDRIWGKPKITVTRNGTKVNFVNHPRFVNDWFSWVVVKIDNFSQGFPVKPPMIVARSTNPNGFTTNLDEVNGFFSVYEVRLISHDSVFNNSFEASYVFN